MKSTAKVDILVPTYNHAHFLGEALASINNQTFTDFSVFVIDNASEDNTQEVVAAWQKKCPQIRYVRNEENIGARLSLLKAYQLTSAEYVTVLCADDQFEPRFLEETVAGLEKNPECVLAYTGYGLFLHAPEHAEHGVETEAYNPHARSGYYQEASLLMIENWITFSVFRRSVCDAVGGLSPEDLYHIGDLYLYQRLAAKGLAYYVCESLARHRRHDATLTGQLVASGRSGFEHLRVPDLVFESDLWPMPTRLLAKANQIRMLTGMRLGDVARAMVSDSAHPLLRALVEEHKAEFFTVIAECILRFTRNHLDTAENGLKLLKDVLNERPDHLAARALYSEFRLEEPEHRQYQAWVTNHGFSEIDGQLFAERMMLKWRTKPVFHFLMFVPRDEMPLLANTLDSLGNQLYDQWRLTVLADFPPPDPMFEQLEPLTWRVIAPGQELSDVLNDAATKVQADWLAFFEPGVDLEPNFLFACADYINIRPEWRLFYTDEDALDPSGRRMEPRFKPDFNLDMLRATDYVGHFLVQRDTYFQCGGYSRLAGAQNYDLLLRALECIGERAIGHIAEVLYHIPYGVYRQGDWDNQRMALAQHLDRLGIPAQVEDGYVVGNWRVVYAHPDTPKVSVIIPTKDKLEFLRPCVESLLSKTEYPNFEVLVVDNQSVEPETHEYYREITSASGHKIRVLYYDYPFNFSAMCNYGVREAKGEYILLLNNDTQVLHKEWLTRMMGHAQRPEVGVVGARLVYPETGLIQHAGVVLGLGYVAEHPYLGLADLKTSGHMNRLQIDQDYSAVTGACLLTRKSVYEQVEGLDEEYFKCLFNDIDYCLKVGAEGYKVVWTPFATLIHHGSVTQKAEVLDPSNRTAKTLQNIQEREFMLDKWLPVLANDPAYNRNLSLAHGDFRPEPQVILNWDPNFHERTKVYGVPLPGGAGDYRIIHPFNALVRAGLAQCEYTRLPGNKARVLTPVELERLKPDVIVMHAALDDVQLQALGHYHRFNRDVFKVYTLDDLVTQVPEKSSVYRDVMRGLRDAKPRLRKALSFCDRLVVSTEPLANLCREMIGDIRVVPNYLQRDKWCDLVSRRSQGKKPRVGWAGAQQHQGDLELIEEVVKALADEVEWVFMGMSTEAIKPYLHEEHPFVPIDQYPAKLASLNLDLALAPLEVHPFNEAKSNLRLLEYGVLGWPVVCTDIYPYRTNDAPVKRVPNNPDAWIEAIRERIHDLDGAYREGDRLREWVLKHYILEDHLDLWLAAFSPAPLQQAVEKPKTLRVTRGVDAKS